MEICYDPESADEKSAHKGSAKQYCILRPMVVPKTGLRFVSFDRKSPAAKLG
jgi:hypothetical protein